MNYLLFYPQGSSGGHQNQPAIQRLPSSSTPVHTLQHYLQPGHSYPTAPYAGLQCAATPAPASLCSTNIQHTVNAASYPHPNVQQTQATGNISASAVSQNATQGYQSPGHHQQQASATCSLTFPLNVQQTCQNCATANQQHAHSASGYPASVQQQTAAAAAAPTLPAQNYPLAPAVQCHPTQASIALQQIQGTVGLSSQPGQSSSPALYNQQVPILQENHQPLLQSTHSNMQLTQHAGQAHIQPQFQHSQETLQSTLKKMAQSTHHSHSLQPTGQQQAHSPTPQKHSQKAMQKAAQRQNYDMSQSVVQQAQTSASQTLSAIAPAAQVAAAHQSYPGAGVTSATSQSYAHSSLNVLQQQTLPAQSQYLPAQSATPQTYGGANQVVPLLSIAKEAFLTIMICIIAISLFITISLFIVSQLFRSVFVLIPHLVYCFIISAFLNQTKYF